MKIESYFFFTFFCGRRVHARMRREVVAFVQLIHSIRFVNRIEYPTLSIYYSDGENLKRQGEKLKRKILYAKRKQVQIGKCKQERELFRTNCAIRSHVAMCNQIIFGDRKY